VSHGSNTIYGLAMKFEELKGKEHAAREITQLITMRIAMSGQQERAGNTVRE